MAHLKNVGKFKCFLLTAVACGLLDGVYVTFYCVVHVLPNGRHTLPRP